MSGLSRRKVLTLGLGAAAGWLGLQHHRSGSVVTRSAFALGTETTITVHAARESEAEQSIAAAFQELDDIEAVMSLYRSNSQIVRLNAERRLNDADERLIAVLDHARMTSGLTNGAFDVTVQPLWRLHAEALKSRATPSSEEVNVARRQIDWRAVEINGRSIVLREPVQAITLNGIAQGYAADRVIAVLREHGIEHALVNTGELAGLSGRADGNPWSVAVQHPRVGDAFAAVAELRDRALATSGDYATAFSPDFARHHVFDPHTGESPSELASVSIVAPTAMQADALSTAAMVLGSNRSLELIASLHDVDALFIFKDGRVLKTAGFPEVPAA